MTVNACTIVARNFLPAARVLALSFRDQHPEGKFTTLLIDDRDRAVDPAAEPFTIRHLDEIGISSDDLEVMPAIYDVMELAVAAKPWLIQALFEEGADTVIYLDADIRLYASLTEAAELAARHGIVLTPHVTAPMPRDGRLSDETTILSSGTYNLGFLAVGPGAEAMLGFWKERLRRDSYVDKPGMRFGDQRWIDFVPGMWPAYILRDPTYNVAYWNLDQRQVVWNGTCYEVDGTPLRFFHFSGYEPDAPHLLSKHQGDKPRILLSECPVIARICDEYRAELLAAGYRRMETVEYGYARLASGLPVDPVMRRVYREAVVASETAGTSRPPGPFEEGGEPFLDWLTTVDAESGDRQTRYLEAVYRSRADLQAAFPHPDATDAERFAEWARFEAIAGRLDLRLVPSTDQESVARAAQTVGAPSDIRPGISVTGHGEGRTEKAELARCVFEAAARAEIPISDTVDGRPRGARDFGLSVPIRGDLNVKLVCLAADELEGFAANSDPEYFADRYNIGLWSWPLETFPEWLAQSLENLDEIWTTSEFSQRAILAVSATPVLVFPLAVAEAPASADDRGAFDLPEGFSFLVRVDLQDRLARSNPLGLIDAFKRAFEPGEGRLLVIETVNGAINVLGIEEIKRAAHGRRDIMITESDLRRDESVSLMAAVDCYASLHRSEGFGVAMAEAMALGKPVVATGYSANLEFMDDETSYLVAWEPADVPPNCDPYPAGARWAEPDLDDAARLLRHVVEERDEAAQVGDAARKRLLERLASDSTIEFVKARFAYAQSQVLGEAGQAVTIGQPLPISNSRLVVLAGSMPSASSPSRHPHIARFIRRFISRVLRHHDEHQREINLALAAALEQLTDSADTLLRRGQQVGASDSLLDSPDQEFVQLTDRRISEHSDRLRRFDHYLEEIRDSLNAVLDDLDEISRALDNYGARLDRAESERAPEGNP